MMRNFLPKEKKNFKKFYVGHFPCQASPNQTWAGHRSWCYLPGNAHPHFSTTLSWNVLKLIPWHYNKKKYWPVLRKLDALDGKNELFELDKWFETGGNGKVVDSGWVVSCWVVVWLVDSELVVNWELDMGWVVDSWDVDTDWLDVDVEVSDNWTFSRSFSRTLLSSATSLTKSLVKVESQGKLGSEK